jgi:hypothetical protein
MPMALQPRELNTLVGCSKRLTAERPVNVSFRERKVALCHVPEANDFGTFMRQSAASDPGCRPAEQPSWTTGAHLGHFFRAWVAGTISDEHTDNPVFQSEAGPKKLQQVASLPETEGNE